MGSTQSTWGVTHCLHLSSARSDRKLLLSQCSDLSLPPASLLPPPVSLLTPRMLKSLRNRDLMPVMAVTELLSPRKMVQFTEKSPLLMERESDSTATLIRMVTPSLSDTPLVRMDSESWKELTFPPELTDKTLLHLLPRLPQSPPQLQFSLLPLLFRLHLLPNPLIMTMLMSQLTPTSTHSSTHMTQPTVTSDSTQTEQTLPPNLPQSLPRTLEFLPALTVPESTPSSTHLTPLTSRLVFWPVTRLASELSNQLSPFRELRCQSDRFQSSSLSRPPPPHPDSSHQATFSSTDSRQDSTLTSPPSNLKV